MTDEAIYQFFKGKTCVSCAALSPDVLCFTLEWSAVEDAKKSDVSSFYFVHHLKDSLKDFEIKFFGDTRRRMAVDHASTELVMIALGGNVLRHNIQGGNSERMLSRDEIRAPLSIRFIEKHFFVAGSFQKILRREGIDQWSDITQDLKSADLLGKHSDFGFNDVDGFNEREIYAVGERGHLWKFDGIVWRKLGVPTDVDLTSVCCAADGYVYVGGSLHTMLRGREENWSLLHQAETNSKFNQIVSFENRVFAVDERGSTLYEVVSDKVGPADTGEFRFGFAGCLCVATGHSMMIVAGSEAAAIYDGKKWRNLFGNTMEGVEKKTLNDVQNTIDAVISELNE